jgi:hypothetical protein
MRNKSLLAAALAVPLLLLGCDRADQSPTAANPSEDKQAMTPSTEDRMLEQSAPAAGTPSPAPTMSDEPSSTMPPPTSPSGETPPAAQSEPPSEPKPSSSY